MPALEALLWSFTPASDDVPWRSKKGKAGIAIVKASATPIGIRPLTFCTSSGCQKFMKSFSLKKRTNRSDSLTLGPDRIKHSLILREDSIIFVLLERARYCYNSETYDPDAFSMEGFNGSLIEFMLKETEKVHAQVGRYKCPDKQPFFPDDLTDPRLPPLQYPQEPSKRIHYGKYVAEAKFQASPAQYEVPIRAQDKGKLMDMLTYPVDEEMSGGESYNIQAGGHCRRR